MKSVALCVFAFFFWGTFVLNEGISQDQPLTVAEKSDFQSTSLSSEVVEFVDWCDEKAEHVTKAVFGETVEGRPMVAAIAANPPFQMGQEDDRVRILVIGNIHSGECAAKEALLMMLREITHDPNHPWLKNAVIAIAPNYNADGNDRIGKGNRPGQIGPANGMGMRENAQHLDLNRDFIKIESPEARSLVGLIDDFNPHLFIDGHTTNGSRHQYALTYDIPHNPAVAPPIRDYLWSKMMPEITQRLEKDPGIFTFYYGNFNRDMSAWTSFGHEPRYSTEYVALRGRLTILSEAYSYISYKERIDASKAFISECIQYTCENAKAVCLLVDQVEKDLINTAQKAPERIQVSMNASVQAYPEKFTAKGFKDDEPHDYQVDFVADYQSTRSVPLPYAYIVPQDQVQIVDRMLMHGIQVHRLTQNATIANTDYHTIKAINRAQRTFQKHNMVTLESARENGERSFKRGDFVVYTAQPLGRLACALLEPSSDDGFAFWNFLDGSLEVDGEFPIESLPAVTELSGLEEVSEVQPTRMIDYADIDGPNSLLSGVPQRLRWHPGTNQYVMSRWGRDFLVNPETGAFDGMVEGSGRQPANLTSALAKVLMGETSNERIREIANNEVLRSPKDNYWIYADSKNHYLFDGETVEILEDADPETELFEFTEDESHLLYVKNNILQKKELSLNQSERLIELRSTYDHYGKLDWVYQEELYGRGNFKGFWYSPVSRRLAVLTLAEQKVGRYTVMDHIPTRGVSEITAYPKAGDPIPNVGMDFDYLLPRGSEQKLEKQMQEEPFGDLISNVCWSPDGQRLFIQVQNREQTKLDLVALDFSTNPSLHYPTKRTTLVSEKTEGWVESYGNPVVFDDGSFLWMSARTGFVHLYHYDKDGQLLRSLTEGEWEVRELLGLDPEQKYAYLTATKDDAINLHGYRVSLETGEMTQITKGDGTHALDFCDDFSYFIDTVSTITTPARSYICRNDGTVLREMETGTDDRLKYLNVTEPEFLEIKAADGHPLDAVIIRPPNFDPQKKYPVLYHVYGGPQAPRVRNRFMGEWYLWHQMLAQKGYIIWMCDNRSSSFRGKAGMWETHRDLGKHELEDIEASVDWLKQQSWVDSNRIGIWGWSYGGYMTAYAMTHSDIFKAGISGAPVTDWRNYDAIYTERLMGLPQDNPEGYESSSVLNAAKDLQGELLLIHGTMDDNVHISNSMQFVHELQKAGKQFDFMVYPKNRHSVRAADQIGHLRKLMTEFILNNL